MIHGKGGSEVKTGIRVLIEEMEVQMTIETRLEEALLIESAVPGPAPLRLFMWAVPLD